MATLIVVVAVLGAAVTMAFARSGPPVAFGGNAEVRGTFQMQGVITDAVDVSGERPGQHVKRRWVIHPVGCRGSVCRSLRLIRNRGAVRNSYVLLHRVRAGVYRGSGAFWVGLECLGRRYRLGSRARYTITLDVNRPHPYRQGLVRDLDPCGVREPLTHG